MNENKPEKNKKPKHRADKKKKQCTTQTIHVRPDGNSAQQNTIKVTHITYCTVHNRRDIPRKKKTRSTEPNKQLKKQATHKHNSGRPSTSST